MSRVLVVEDESAIAELISLNLRHAGYEVTIAASAEQAQAAVDGVLPDLVLLDWMLPGQSGLALARRWRGEARTRELPIIMLTARADEADKVAGLDAGADDYLAKPFSTNELMARIRAVLRRKAPEALDVAVELGGLSTDRLRLGSIKVVADGSIQGFSARLRAPGYFNGAPNGLWYTAPETIRGNGCWHHLGGVPPPSRIMAGLHLPIGSPPPWPSTSTRCGAYHESCRPSASFSRTSRSRFSRVPRSACLA